VVHITGAPVIGSGSGFTFTVAVMIQLVGRVYVMVSRPTPVAFSVPLVRPTVAILLFVLSHVPPNEASLNDRPKPRQTCEPPVMFAGSGFTVTGAVDAQPI